MILRRTKAHSVVAVVILMVTASTRAQHGQAFFNLALTQIKLGREKEANETLLAALRAYNSAGEAHLQANRLKEAEEAFRAMLQIDPEYPLALLRISLICNEAGSYEKAEANARRVTLREPKNPTAHAILAEALTEHISFRNL